MDIAELLTPFRPLIVAHDWDGLENDVENSVAASTTSEAALALRDRVAAVDLTGYLERLTDAYGAALEAAVPAGAVWICFTWAPESAWKGSFVMGSEPPVTASPAEPAMPRVEGPDQPELAAMLRAAATLPPEERAALELLLMVRTVAAFGRVVDAVPSEGFTVAMAPEGEADLLPILNDGDDPAGGTSLAVVASYSRPFEAQFAHARLESSGIPAYIADAHTVGMNWLYSNAIGGVKLQVAARNLEAARLVLEQDVEEDLGELVELDESFLCPNCGGRHTRYLPIHQPWYRALWTGAILLFGLAAPTPTEERICDDCGHRWKVDAAAA